MKLYGAIIKKIPKSRYFDVGTFLVDEFRSVPEDWPHKRHNLINIINKIGQEMWGCVEFIEYDLPLGTHITQEEFLNNNQEA